MRGMRNDEVGDGNDFSVVIYESIDGPDGSQTGGNPTDGCIAINLIDGDFWSGVYVQKDGKYSCKTGSAADFGYNLPLNTVDKTKRGSYLICSKNNDGWETSLYFYNNGYGYSSSDSSNPPKHWIEKEDRWEYIP